METTVEDQGPCRKQLHVEIPSDEVQSTFDEVADEFRKQAQVPGYRKGRAPESIIKARFRKQILEQVRDRIVPDSYRDAIAEQDFKVVNVLDATQPEIALGEPMRYSITLDLEPEIELPEYKGIPVTRELKQVTDEDVNEVVRRICEQHAEFFDRAEGDAVAADDLVQLAYQGTLDGEPLSGLGIDLLVGSDDFWTQANEHMGNPEAPPLLPGLGTAVVGRAIGESGPVDVAFDETCPEESLRGKTVTYEVTVQGGRGRSIPDLDDELAVKAGAESADDLRTRLREQLETEAVRAADAKLRGDVATTLLGRIEFDMPESVVESETREEIYSQVNRISQQGADESFITEHKDEIFNNANQSVKERMKARYLLTRIAAAENIDANPREIDDEITRLAGMYRMSPADLRQSMEERNSLSDLKTDVLVRKTMDFLVEHAEVQG